MALKISTIGRVFVTNWPKKFDQSDVDQVIRMMQRARLRTEAPLHYLGMVPSDAEVPGKEERAALVRLAKEAPNYCERVHVVISSSGFLSSIHRSVVTAIIVLLHQWNFVTINSSFDEAMAKLKELLPLDGEALRLIRGACCSDSTAPVK